MPALAGTDEAALRRRAAELDRREAELADRATSLAQLDRAVAGRVEQLPPWSPGVHDAPVRPVVPGPVTKALYDRLDGDDLRALEAAFDAETAAYWANADPAVRPYLTLHFGAYHGVTQILDKTGLSASMPPDEVHAMARGPLAAGGDPYIADLVVEAVERAGGSLRPGMRGLDFGCSSGRVVRMLAAALPDVAWSGCDPNAGAIGWASEQLHGIDFFVSPQAPPLELRGWSARPGLCDLDLVALRRGRRAALVRRDAPRCSGRAGCSSSPPTG